MNKIILLLLLNVTFLFSQEGKIKKIEFLGLKKTKSSFLKKIIETKEAASLDSLKLKRDVQRLKRLPSVAHAYTTLKKETDSLYIVIFNIEESTTILPELAFWTTTNNQFSYKLGVYEYNFLGRNITAGGFYQNNGYDTYAVNLIAPNLFSKHLGLALSHQNWKSEEPLFFDNQTANYLYNNISTEILGLYQVNLHHKITFGFNYFTEKYNYLTGATSANVPLNLEVDKILYKLLYTYQDLEYFFQYIDGFKSSLYLQYVQSQNSFQDQFLVAWNDFFYYKRIGEKGNWANRLRIGFASNNDSPFAPFALDNNVNLRGVGILVDRGTASIVYNTEYRHTFYDKKWLTIQGNAFIDAGTWRQPGGEINDFWEDENIRLFSGVGLRFINKKIYNATLRIDYGFSLKDNTKGLVFGIGQYF
ncbi:POTRA domain-containing protein [Tenacibaculum sp. M341]|uniref:POTRA domain-containing protein n=1 Tax=Tenacibaculum sp. M341 TaxID=2530339 RepID=UPI0010494B8D|nr:POTRA domain-containing protein [Tenacibaculum sp. M341]TCI84920.1 outer membrane protein assembly factor [Tenacibaculum sp. M341]